jgi:predicted ATPase
MNEDCNFASLLRAFMARALCTNQNLARLTGISVRTIEKWTAEEMRRPRYLLDVLKVARVLLLNAQDTTALLCAAEHPPLAVLQAQICQTDDPQLMSLLSWWDSAEKAPSAPELAGAGARNEPVLSVSTCHQLRPPVADFVGRACEAAQLVTALQAAMTQRVGVVISGVQGMGGIGKTELAYVVAHYLGDAFPDAQIMLNLRGSSVTPLTPVQAMQHVIHTFFPDVSLPENLEAVQQRYLSVLHDRRALILADDARDVAQVHPLLPPAGCALLITSRTRFTLPGMVTIDLEQLGEDEAAALLRRICPRLSVAEAQRLARACGYLPLALRISGGILRNDPALPVGVYLARLADERQRLQQLRDPDEPQLDVAASLALSYALLDAPAQQVFRQLGVLVTDFDLPLARAVVEAPPKVDVDATQHLLLRRNLVMYDLQCARWRLHDLVRDLARGELESAGEWAATMWRYARASIQIAQETQEQ